MAGDVLRRLCSQFGPEDQRAAQQWLCHHTWAVYPRSQRAGCSRQTLGRSWRGLLHGQRPARKKRRWVWARGYPKDEVGKEEEQAHMPSLPGDVLLRSPLCCAAHGIHLVPNLGTEPKEGLGRVPSSSTLIPLVSWTLSCYKPIHSLTHMPDDQWAPSLCSHTLTLWSNLLFKKGFTTL